DESRGWSFRCGLPRMAAFSGRDASGKGLAIGPNCAVFKVLLFPNGYSALERVDHPATGLEGSVAVCGGDDDGDAGLHDLQPPKSVRDSDMTDGKLFKSLMSERVHLFKRHLRVGLVIQVKGAASASVIPYYSFKDHSSAIFGLLELCEERICL